MLASDYKNVAYTVFFFRVINQKNQINQTIHSNSFKPLCAKESIQLSDSGCSWILREVCSFTSPHCITGANMLGCGDKYRSHHTFFYASKNVLGRKSYNNLVAHVHAYSTHSHTYCTIVLVKHLSLSLSEVQSTNTGHHDLALFSSTLHCFRAISA